jgi:hypothetical protein
VLSKAGLASFMEKLPFYRARINRQRICGNAVAARIIEDHLSGTFAPEARRLAPAPLVSSHAVA